VQVFGSDHEKSDNSKEKNKVMNFHVTWTCRNMSNSVIEFSTGLLANEN
jgi:hypothetical protein